MKSFLCAFVVILSGWLLLILYKYFFFIANFPRGPWYIFNILPGIRLVCSKRMISNLLQSHLKLDANPV